MGRKYFIFHFHGLQLHKPGMDLILYEEPCLQKGNQVVAVVVQACDINTFQAVDQFIDSIIPTCSMPYYLGNYGIFGIDPGAFLFQMSCFA